MELRDHITQETSAFVDRLIAASEAATQQIRREADEAISQLRGRHEHLREELQSEAGRTATLEAQLEAETERTTSLAAQLQAESERGAALAALADRETSRANDLAGQLEAETNRTAALAGQLETESTRSSELAAHFDAESARANALTGQLAAEQARTTDLSAQLDEEVARTTTLAAQLEAETARAGHLLAQADAETVRTTAIAKELDAANARATQLAADLDTANNAAGRAEAARLKAEAALQAATSELQDTREQLEVVRAEAAHATQALQTERAERGHLKEEHDAIARNLHEQAQAAAKAATGLEAMLATADARTREAVAAAEAEVQRLRAQVEEQAAAIRERDTRLEEADATVTYMREQVDEANAITDATSGELKAARERIKRVTTMFSTSAASLGVLEGAATMSDIFGTLVQQLAAEFERVAIFRVKGNHLEGEMAAGLDGSVDITKIVIPMGLSSTITKAATGGSLQHASKEEISDSRPPFGGSPASALAAPLVFQGEVLAVVYADADTLFTDAHGPFAGVLVSHANALLGRLAQELTAAKQLRDYARLLLEEAEAVYVADLEAKLPEHDCLQRLRGSIQFAHDLYAQRAALEAPIATNLLDEAIAALVAAESPTPFGNAVASIAQDRHAQRTA